MPLSHNQISFTAVVLTSLRSSLKHKTRRNSLTCTLRTPLTCKITRLRFALRAERHAQSQTLRMHFQLGYNLHILFCKKRTPAYSTCAISYEFSSNLLSGYRLSINWKSLYLRLHHLLQDSHGRIPLVSKSIRFFSINSKS